ncbi:MAG: hypothetical protein ACRELE_05640, partial [Gemmatimonadales bacterium]
MMTRRLACRLFALAAATTPLPAQLPLITVPPGALRIDLSGSFYPNDQIWDNGTRRPLGSTLDGTSNGLISTLQRSLSQLLGQSVSGLSLGTVNAIAAREHGVGKIGLAY